MTFAIIAFLIFSGALFLAAYYCFSVPQQQAATLLAARLREIRARSVGARVRPSSDIVREQRESTFSFVGQFFTWVGPIRRLQENIDQANLTYRAGDILMVCVLITIGVFVLMGVFGVSVIPLRALFAVGAGCLPVLWVARKRSERMKKFEENFPDAIDLFNRSMRAGHNIHSGLETVAQETADPIRMEFKKLVEELALGSQLEAALHNLGRRVPLLDVKFFITGLILQRQTGANMVLVLENLGSLVRERLTLSAKMRSATTQQRFSAGLLCVLPIIVAIGFWFVKPEYIRMLYTDETGSKFLTYAIVSEIVGILVIRRLSNLKF